MCHRLQPSPSHHQQCLHLQDSQFLQSWPAGPAAGCSVCTCATAWGSPHRACAAWSCCLTSGSWMHGGSSIPAVDCVPDLRTFPSRVLPLPFWVPTFPTFMFRAWPWALSLTCWAIICAPALLCRGSGLANREFVPLQRRYALSSPQGAVLTNSNALLSAFVGRDAVDCACGGEVAA